MKKLLSSVLVRLFGLALSSGGTLSLLAQPPAPPQLYVVLTNAQVWTINATNAQVLNTNTITGFPAGWSIQELTWCPRDAVFYAFQTRVQLPLLDTYLVRIDPVSWEMKTNAHLGVFNYSSEAGDLYEGMTYVESLADLIVSHRSGAHQLASDQILRLSTNGAVSFLVNNNQDNDLLAYDSRRDLSYMLDSGNSTVSGSSNMFAKISLGNSGILPLRFFKNSDLTVLTYHRSLDAFYVSYRTNGAPGLYRWITDGSQTVTESFAGAISGLISSDSVTAIAPVPQAPTVAVKSSGAVIQEVCVPKSFGFSATAIPGTGPVKSVSYFDGAAFIGSSTNAASSFSISTILPLGLHQISAQAFDGYLAATSQVQTVLLIPPSPNHMAAQLLTNDTFLCCLGGTVSNTLYVIQSTTNIVFGANVWVPFSTNRALSDLLVITNTPLEKAKFFRAVLP